MSKIILKEETTSPTTPATDKVIIYPKTDGKIYSKNDLGVETQLSNPGGDVVGPASSTAGAVAIFDGTTGKLLKNSTNFFHNPISGYVGVGTVSPSSHFDVVGCLGLLMVNKTANYTLNHEYGVSVDTTAGDVTITLPLASLVPSRTYCIKKTDSSVNSVIIQPSGSDTIRGDSQWRLVMQYDSVIVISDATVGIWRILSVYENTPYAQLSSSVSQQPVVTTPVAVTMNQNDEIFGITHSTVTNPDRIIIKKKGRYATILSAQIGKTSGSTNINVDVWLRKNGVDLPRSNSRTGILATTDTNVVTASVITALNKDDYLQIMMSISATGVGAGLIATSPAGEPMIPSIIVSVYEV